MDLSLLVSSLGSCCPLMICKQDSGNSLVPVQLSPTPARSYTAGGGHPQVWWGGPGEGHSSLWLGVIYAPLVTYG